MASTENEQMMSVRKEQHKRLKALAKKHNRSLRSMLDELMDKFDGKKN